METKPEPKYQMGPAPQLLQEIGQIMVNYSECERSIYGVFKGIMSLDDQDAYLLVKHANLNAEKMVNVIRAEIKRVKPALFAAPLLEAIEIFKSSIEHRNIVAHWQWALTDGSTGLAINAMKAKPGESPSERAYDLGELKLTAWRLAKAAMLLSSVAIGMFDIRKGVLAHPGWEPSAYSNRGPVDEWMLQYGLDMTRQHISRMDEFLAQPDNSPSSEKAQR